MKSETSQRQLVVVEDNQATSSSHGYIYIMQNVLVVKELRFTKLESLVKEAEMKAEQARKARELTEWGRDLQRRERQAR